MEFSTLEIIGLAFLSGLKINELADEVLKEDEEKDEEKEDKNPKHMATECEVEAKKITAEEMADILDNLKNKILGGK